MYRIAPESFLLHISLIVAVVFGAFGCSPDVNVDRHPYLCDPAGGAQCGPGYICRQAPGDDFFACFSADDERFESHDATDATDAVDTSDVIDTADASDITDATDTSDATDADDATTTDTSDVAPDTADTGEDACTDCQCQPTNGGIEQCTDSQDNDCDGLIDCQDPDCPSCSQGGDCTNQVKDTNETDVDCGGACGPCDDGQSCQTDNDCLSTRCNFGTCGEGICDDGQDNDGDGQADCADPECLEVNPTCAEQANQCADGQDNDGDGRADCHDPDCLKSGACSEAFGSCTNGTDDDADGLVDCDDSDCANTTCARLIFATGDTYTGGMGGTAGADGLCMGESRMGGLHGEWKAILSTTTQDASAQLELRGKLLNTNGDVVADSSNELCGGTTLAPVRYDAAGNDLLGSTSTVAWTGTTSTCTSTCSGTTGCCSDWTSSANDGSSATTGLIASTNDSLTLEGPGGKHCNDPARLYCVSGQVSEYCDDGQDNDGDSQIDCADPDCAGHRQCAQRIFASSATYSGDFANAQPGVEATVVADDECQRLAQEAGLYGVWRAILSTQQTPARDHVRIEQPVYNMHRELILENPNGPMSAEFFWDPTHPFANAVLYDERGRDIASNTFAWTGTRRDGSPSPADCMGWRNTSASGQAGSLTATAQGWTESQQPSCTMQFRLYCIDGQ